MPNMIKVLLDYLEHYEILLETYTLTNTKFEGVIKIRDRVRKLDIFLSNATSWPFMLLHATGSKQLNIKLRRKAYSMDLELSEVGLFDKITNIFVLFTDDEKDIFKWLGVEYIEPEDRNIQYII